MYSVKCGFYNMLFVQRLRTENRLLKQRIDTLEKVSASVFVTRATKQTSLPAHQHYINPPGCVCSYIMHLLLMMESCLSLTGLC